MKNSKPLSFLLLLSIFTLNACKKECHGPKSTSVEGKVVLNVHVVHHTWDVSYTHVYLKYNTTTFPGADSTLYDLKQTTDGNGEVSFNKLYPGNYYLYTKGFDSTFGATVTGYKQITISPENLINNQMSVTLYVSE